MVRYFIFYYENIIIKGTPVFDILVKNEHIVNSFSLCLFENNGKYILLLYLLVIFFFLLGTLTLGSNYQNNSLFSWVPIVPYKENIYLYYQSIFIF